MADNEPNTSEKLGVLFEEQELDVSFCENVIARAWHAKTNGHLDIAERLFCMVNDILSTNELPLAAETMILADLNRADMYYSAQRRFGKAWALMTRTLARSRELLGNGHFYTALLLANMGECRVKQGMLRSANKWYEQAADLLYQMEMQAADQLLIYATITSAHADLLDTLGKADRACSARQKAGELKVAADCATQRKLGLPCSHCVAANPSCLM